VDFLSTISETRNDVDYFNAYRRNMGFSFGMDIIFPRGTLDDVKVRKLKIEYVVFPLVEQLNHVIKVGYAIGSGKL